MPLPLSPEAIAQLLQPYLAEAALPAPMFPQLAVYLELILKWNARINLTAIRKPEEIVRRHFGESLFTGLHLATNEAVRHGQAPPIPPSDFLLDLGSGAGFPGIPIQLLRPDRPVTLAESRSRKAAFLREVVRVLGLKTEVWAARAEAMQADRQFDTVTLRAVDEMGSAVAEAARRATCRIAILGIRRAAYTTLPASFRLAEPIALPDSRDGILLIARRDTE